MRLLPSDPDIKTLVGRIRDEDIDLQPEFQRGEVWGVSKRQRLIDSILRDWHVPPVHVVLDSDEKVAVLDGQQRLVSIRDFVDGKFSVDGSIPPFDNAIARLDGMTYDELPDDVRRRFDRFPIRLFTIVDHKPSEPAELFYRLNQLSTLTAAEQRNAFFGAARKQVKDLAMLGEKDQSYEVGFGFSNSRMSYDDVITRVLYLLDAGTLRTKITSSLLADKYRSGKPFTERSVSRTKRAIQTVTQAQEQSSVQIKLNKATAQSWLVFIASVDAQDKRASKLAPDFLIEFEVWRNGGKRALGIEQEKSAQRKRIIEECRYVYGSRSTSRVADVSSVVLRDLVIWIQFFFFLQEIGCSFQDRTTSHHELWRMLKNGDYKSVERIADDLEWGDLP